MHWYSDSGAWRERMTIELRTLFINSKHQGKGKKEGAWWTMIYVYIYISIF